MNNVKIPNYSLSEELINSISHGIGSIISITFLVFSIIYSNNIISLLSSIIYSLTMFFMYTDSCLYHAFKRNCKAKKVFRIIDHSDIYIFICGSYTPYCLCVLKGKLGIILLIIIWILGILGVILKCININKYNKISFILYLLMGWLIILTFNYLKELLCFNSLYLLIMGGITYTIGSIIYIIGSKYKYFHSIFHFYVLFGSIFHLLSIMFIIF